ncbi:hypothetical protein CBS63078_1886 [Aspergillus niger]|uniref:ER lumen protein retaining receptor n=3 Tax=Aspergillus TaxID=5052 RepID=A0A370PSU1_ASPPH|nr:uncharacterized protein BO96DRAFT_411376 [Aspergillus niger CBS 101883]KAI2829422.1 hypothetical protein CBS133816_4431 [Aspergillus niger]RDK45231.1 hypothetical protein M752DRAFT_274491 [Aspergillus phoenicis ATCC 13157]KAI2854803.1 hypothetical protein CBS12448_7567 [Aspergillus niger]KAI2885845.1 hypothetical protein CBS11852_8174 [Aspergillus niger]KAI2904455.1 hypothetical protein CBS13152_487 [Aspergillus niger]
MLNLNIFRLLADLSHISSKCVLIWAIHRNKSAEGVSLLTQMLYALVFVTRYLDLFSKAGWKHFYLVFFKLFYIISSFYVIYLMMRVFPRTRERERAWKMAIISVALSLVLAPISIVIFYRGYPDRWFTETCWTFSIILESVCVLPQLLLLRQTTVPTVIDSYYLLMLGSYRAFYILNWLVRGLGSEGHWDVIADLYGVIQTAFYVDFAWVYYSRQRVKLRNGGVVDSEDFRHSWLVSKILNFRQRRSADEEQNLNDEDVEDEEVAGGGRPRNNRWGARGISVSADDTLGNHRGTSQDESLEGFLEDEEDDEDNNGYPVNGGVRPKQSTGVTGSHE